MKFGILYHKYTPNIGDDLWAYATSKLLPQVDYVIDYGEISQFRSRNGEDVAAVISGVPIVDTNKYPFIPSPDIIPYFTSCHLHPEFAEYLSEGLIHDYIKAYQPIGARSEYTLKFLGQNGIEAFFSGCITMTLKPDRSNEPKNRSIVVADVPIEVMRTIYRDRPKYKNAGFKVEMFSHDNKNLPNLSWSERVRLCEKALSVYQNAHCVVTSRLHVALPCLALGTPVLIVKPRWHKHDIDEARFVPFNSLINFCFVDEFIDGKSGFSLLEPPPNSMAFTQ